MHGKDPSKKSMDFQKIKIIYIYIRFISWVILYSNRFPTAVKFGCTGQAPGCDESDPRFEPYEASFVGTKEVAQSTRRIDLPLVAGCGHLPSSYDGGVKKFRMRRTCRA